MAFLGIFGKKKKDTRKMVIEGIIFGIALTALLWFVLWQVLPGCSVCTKWKMATVIKAIKWSIFPLTFYFISFLVVGLSRSCNDHLIDPLNSKEDKVFKINSNVFDNTTHHFLMFFVTLMITSLFLPACMSKVIPILSILFVIGRIIFWVAYRINPPYRSIGLVMSGSFFIFIIYDLVQMLKYLF